MGQSSWKRQKGKPGIETIDFMHQCSGWRKARRFVAVRKQVSVTTKETLFPVPEYEFFCYVTNNPSNTPWSIHKLYGQRATSETGLLGAKARWLPVLSALIPFGPIPPFSRVASWLIT